MECFFDYLTQFIKVMINVFPGDKKLKVYDSNLQMLKIAGEFHMRSVYEVFQKALTADIVSAIEKRDQQYLESLSVSVEDNNVLAEIQYIQKRVNELTDVEKQTVWEYIDCLVESASDI